MRICNIFFNNIKVLWGQFPIDILTSPSKKSVIDSGISGNLQKSSFQFVEFFTYTNLNEQLYKHFLKNIYNRH